MSDKSLYGLLQGRSTTHWDRRNLNASVVCTSVGWMTALGCSRWRAVPFGLLCGLVAAISVYDALLVIVNHEVIVEMEQNPIGRWLLALHSGEVGLFVLVKLAMTALVCTLLLELYERWRRGGLMVVAGVASFQTMLLVYLTIM